MSQPPQYLEELPGVDVPGQVVRPPAPATESAGPPLTDMIMMLQRTAAGLEALYLHARREAMYRQQSGVTQGQTDGSGDVAIPLFSVPQGATGYLLHVTIDEAGVTPAVPDTSAGLWHAIYASASASAEEVGAVVAVGQLLDFQLNAPTRGDAMLPDVYKYGDKYGAPTLVGPQTFYVVIRGAVVARQVAARYTVLVEQPE